MRFDKCAAWSAIVLAIWIQSAPAGDISALAPHMRQSSPDGPGPFPAVLMLSGCSGFSFGGGTHYDEVQTRLTKLGFVVVRVDSLVARQETRCDGSSISRDDQAEDVRIVASYLRQQSNVKAGAINILGWSWGGGGALAAAMAGTGIDAAVVYYPACNRLASKPVEVPTLILFGEADNVVSIGRFSSPRNHSRLGITRTPIMPLTIPHLIRPESIDSECWGSTLRERKRHGRSLRRS